MRKLIENLEESGNIDSYLRMSSGELVPYGTFDSMLLIKTGAVENKVLGHIVNLGTLGAMRLFISGLPDELSPGEQVIVNMMARAEMKDSITPEEVCDLWGTKLPGESTKLKWLWFMNMYDAEVSYSKFVSGMSMRAIQYNWAMR